MELEEGMYIKVLGQIRQIKQIENNSLTNVDLISLDKCIDYWGNYDDFIDKNTFIKFKGKASHNPIDLIEVGDYVNGYKVCEIIEKGQKSYNGEIAKEKCFCLGNNYNFKCYNNEIENIVTKEQFEGMKYVIE